MAGGRTADDDAAVVQRVLQGDVEAFGVLVHRYRTMFGQYAVTQCCDADLAADAMQEAFIRAYDRLATCAHPERFGAWFFRILRNQCHNHRTRQRAYVALDAVATPGPSRTEDRAERGELRARLETALEHLSVDQREAFVLHHVEGRSYAEMASLLGTREDRLRMRVHRARDAVRRELEGVYG
jgi:RNA polymerase sigma-70 factor (ECF subfamily)